jgi:hypothetical protein
MFIVSHKTSFLVNAIGFSKRDNNLLRCIFSLANHPKRSYELTNGSLYDLADIALVNIDDAYGIAAWDALSRIKPDVSVVLVARKVLPDWHCYVVKYPFVASRLLNVLNKVTLKKSAINNLKLRKSFIESKGFF